MSSAKLKNIIIIVLLIFNAILLSVLVHDNTNSRRARDEEIDALKTVLTQKGMELAEEIDFGAKAPQSCTILRDSKADDSLMAGMIGSSYKEDMGGNIMFYSAGKGQAILRGTGEMDLVFNEDLPAVENNEPEAVAKYMRTKGIALEPELAKCDGSAIVMPCKIDDHCVYNANLSFTVSDEKLMMINGTRVFDGKKTEVDEKTLDCVGALMSFVDIVTNDGYVCSRIVNAEAGYFLTVSVSGESSLRPVWRIDTDTGTVFINAVSGKQESMAI